MNPEHLTFSFRVTAPALGAHVITRHEADLIDEPLIIVHR